MFVSGRFAGVSAAAGNLVAASSASTIACGPGLGLTEAKDSAVIGPDHETPTTFPPARYFVAGGPSGADVLYSSTSPFTASASCEPSGLQASPSGCGSMEFTCLAAAAGLVADDGVG